MAANEQPGVPQRARQKKPMLPRSWPVFRSFAGFGAADLPHDLIAGLVLAAIAIPEQIATARLGNFPPGLGFIAFIAGSAAFAAFGASRYLSAGADSTITPIFAGSIALFAAAGSPAYAADAAALALMVGLVVATAGILRMGWIANLLSVPVTTGFLAGIAVHIAASQLPSLFGVPAGAGEPLRRIALLVSVIDRTNPFALGLGIGVLALTMAAEKISAKIPGALVGVVLAGAAVFAFGLRARGVAVLGAIPLDLSHLGLPAFEPRDLLRIAPLALIISLVIMVQTAATTRSFPSSADTPPDVNHDFVGIGAGCVLSGLAGGFPVDASPPRTAISTETGARSQASGLVAAALVGGLAMFGTGLLAYVPTAALAGVLLFVAQRITRVRVFATVFRESKGEFGLMMVTAAAVVILPIETGVGIGIVLSLFHGLWSATRTRLIEFEHVPGTSIWWPNDEELAGEKLPGILVVAFQAPLSFLNAYDFRSDFLAAIERRALSLVVLEAGSIVELDFTAALILAEVIRRCRNAGATFAIARLESVRAQQALTRFGVTALLGTNCQFRSVDDAIRALAPGDSASPR